MRRRNQSNIVERQNEVLRSLLHQQRTQQQCIQTLSCLIEEIALRNEAISIENSVAPSEEPEFSPQDLRDNLTAEIFVADDHRDRSRRVHQPSESTSNIADSLLASRRFLVQRAENPPKSWKKEVGAYSRVEAARALDHLVFSSSGSSDASSEHSFPNIGANASAENWGKWLRHLADHVNSHRGERIQYPRAPFPTDMNESTMYVFCTDQPLLAQMTPTQQAQCLSGTYNLGRADALDVPLGRATPWQPEGELEVEDDPVERLNALLFIKLFLFIVLFDLDLEYLTILAVVFFLHVNGVFDPILRWAQRRNDREQRPPLEGVLRNLQMQRQVASEARAAQTGNVTPASPASLDNTAEVNSPSEAAPEPEPVVNASKPSALTRAFYQTVVMFFATLLPWWKPEQRYLQ